MHDKNMRGIKYFCVVVGATMGCVVSQTDCSSVNLGYYLQASFDRSVLSPWLQSEDW